MPELQRPAQAGPAPTTAAPEAAPATADPAVAQATVLGNSEMQARMGAMTDADASLLGDGSDDVKSLEVKQRITETISNAPDPHGAWNGVFGWDSKFALVLDPSLGTCTIVVRIFTGADEATRAKWASAIEGKWGGKYCLEVSGANATDPAKRYSIGCDLQWVDDSKDAHFSVTANEAAADEGGRAGLGGTTSMTGWGVGDDVDVTHEFGHMLGAVEDYFTTNGVDHTEGGKAGFRDEGGGIMNNPSDDPFAEHYELVRVNAAKMLDVDASRVKVV